MTMNCILLTPILVFSLGSPELPDLTKTAELARPIGTWDGRGTMVIEQNHLHGRIGRAALVFKARYEITNDGVLHGVVTEASNCLTGDESDHLRKGDRFSFSFRVEGGSLTLTDLKGQFLGEWNQKQAMEGVYKKR